MSGVYASFETPCKILRSFNSHKTLNTWMRLHRSNCSICKNFEFQEAKPPGKARKVDDSLQTQKFMQNFHKFDYTRKYWFKIDKTGEIVEGKIIKCDDGQIMIGIYVNGKIKIYPSKELTMV